MSMPVSAWTRANTSARACLLLLLKGTLLTILLGTLYEFVGAEVKDDQHELNCISKGFVPSELDCSKCEALKDFDLSVELFEDCESCCTQFDVAIKVCTFVFLIINQTVNRLLLLFNSSTLLLLLL